MLTKGIQLTMLIGPVVPIPVPQVVMDALDSIQVTAAAGEASGFQINLQFNSKSELNTIFLIAGATNSGPATPPLRVMLIVTLNGMPQPLFDGVMTNVQVQAGGNGAPGMVTITGEDLSKVMRMIDFIGLP